MDYLNIVQWNAQSLLSNQYIFSLFLYEKNIHIAVLCETWLKPRHHIRFKNYEFVRLDSGNDHNGVAILIHKSLNFKKLDTFSDDSIQNIAIRLYYGNNKELTILSLYSPKLCSLPFTKQKFNNLIQSLPEPLVIAGDFNALHHNWGCMTSDTRGSDILECVDDNSLVILNDGQMTTVGSHRWRQNALDLTIVSPELAVSCDWSVHDDPLGSYHLPVITKVFVSNISSDKQIIFPDSKPYPHQHNYRIIKWDLFSVVSDTLLQNFQYDQENPLKSYEEFMYLINIAIELSMPDGHRNHGSRSKPNTYYRNRPPLPWWNAKCASAVEQSKLAYIN